MANLTYTFRAQSAQGSGNSQQLVEAINSFDDKQQVPLVSGTPKIADPALGWVVSIAVQDGVISGVVSVTDAETLSRVEARPDKRVGVAVYPPNSPNNPTPGKPSLRHISVVLDNAEFADMKDCVSFACFPAADVQFAAPAGFEADDEKLSHWRRAQAYAATRGVSMIEAAIATEDQPNN